MNHTIEQTPIATNYQLPLEVDYCESLQPEANEIGMNTEFAVTLSSYFAHRVNCSAYRMGEFQPSYMLNEVKV
jgi:hypothetical protein